MLCGARQTPELYNPPPPVGPQYKWKGVQKGLFRENQIKGFGAFEKFPETPCKILVAPHLLTGENLVSATEFLGGTKKGLPINKAPSFG